MIPATAARVPLVRHPKAPALPLDERITRLTGLTAIAQGERYTQMGWLT
ncbi:hypothetical protein ACFV1B_10015 [Streptomyces sp. NPDC059637]